MGNGSTRQKLTTAYSSILVRIISKLNLKLDLIFPDVGDIMERWTNGYYKSTLHRVAFNEQSEKRDRYSIVYFCMPNWEQALQPIDAKNSSREQENKDGMLFGDMIPFV